MLERIDCIANANRWRQKPEALTILCGGLMVCTLSLPPWPMAPTIGCLAVALAVVGAKVPLRILLRSLRLPVGFIALSCVGLCWSISWDRGFRVAFSPLGAMMALRVGLRALAAMAVTLLFAFTVPIAQWLRILRRLGAPESLLELLQLSYRSIFLLEDVKETVLRAQCARLGYDEHASVLRSMAQALAAILLRAVQRSSRLEQGLAARGYDGRLCVLMPSSETRLLHLLLAIAVPVLVALAGWICRRMGLI